MPQSIQREEKNTGASVRLISVAQQGSYRVRFPRPPASRTFCGSGFIGGTGGDFGGAILDE